MQDDHDNPEWTEADFARAKPADQLPPEVLAAFPNTRKRMGRPPSANRKEVVTIRLDKDLVEAARATGEGWQTRINDILRGALLKA